MKCATLMMREGKPGGGKGPLVADNRSQCLATQNTQTLFLRGGCESMSYDGYNQAGMLECAHTLRTANGTEGDDRTVKVVQSLDPDIASMRYIVRRLTPMECERLQGLPDGYTTVHFTEDMLTDEILDEFVRVKLNWDTINAAEGKQVKAKTREQIRKWLLDISAEPPDAPRYKACGNGWACNQPRWIVMNLLNTQHQGWDDAPAPDTTPCLDMGGGKSACKCEIGISPTQITTHYGAPVIADAPHYPELAPTITARNDGSPQPDKIDLANMARDSTGKIVSVCDDEDAAYAWWRDNFNPNPDDCCNLRREAR